MTEARGSTDLSGAVELATRLQANVETVVHGKSDEIRLVLAALVCDGHVCSRTSLERRRRCSPARSQAPSTEQPSRASSARRTSSRQTSPDCRSSTSATRDFEFRPGPVFANVLLVDEINRAMPKTQSALLEAMAERQVTIDGVTHLLPAPFLVLATENPIEQEGTFPLPEAQLDRFLLQHRARLPGEDDELRIVEEQVERHPLRGSGPSSRSRR